MAKWLLLILISICSQLGYGSLQTVSVDDTTRCAIRAHADSIIAGTCQPVDDEYTLACLGNLLSDSETERKYYFEVTKVIMAKCDGALSEVVGGYLLNYLDSFPYEFVVTYRKLPAIERNRVVFFIGSEIYLGANNTNEAVRNIDLKFEELITKSVRLTMFRKDLGTFKALLKRAVKSMEN